MKWLKLTLILIGFLAFSAVVWFAGPLIGFGEAHPFDPVWVRALIIALLVFVRIVWSGLFNLRSILLACQRDLFFAEFLIVALPFGKLRHTRHLHRSNLEFRAISRPVRVLGGNHVGS